MRPSLAVCEKDGMKQKWLVRKMGCDSPSSLCWIHREHTVHVLVHYPVDIHVRCRWTFGPKLLLYAHAGTYVIPGRNCCGEVDTVIVDLVRSALRNVLPVSSSSATCKQHVLQSYTAWQPSTAVKQQSFTWQSFCGHQPWPVKPNCTHKEIVDISQVRAAFPTNRRPNRKRSEVYRLVGLVWLLISSYRKRKWRRFAKLPVFSVISGKDVDCMGKLSGLRYATQ